MDITTTGQTLEIDVPEMEEMQQRTKNMLDQVQDVTHKTVLAYVGAWGLAYDEATELWSRSRDMVDRAVDRGEKVEDRVSKEARQLREETEHRLEVLQRRLRRREEEAEAEMEEEVESILTRLNLPSRSSIASLQRQVDSLSRKVDDALARRRAATVTAPAAETIEVEPFPGYDELTAREIIERLDALTIEQMVALKQYEMAHENRVTVIREVDRRLEAMPIARYDELTVEEIEPMLNTMTREELQAVARYEQAHENRVTLLRAIDSELEEREEAAG